MKHPLCILFFVGISNVFAFADTLQNKLLPTNDSGFVTKKEGVAFLVANFPTDTTQTWTIYKQTDTIGKYYRLENSDNYIMCLIYFNPKDYFETHLVIEITPNGELVKSEEFIHGHYSCCWNNAYNGFSKYGDFFGIKTCGTGSGYCSGQLYLFKNVISQNSADWIPFECESYGVYDDDFAIIYYTSNIEIKKDEFIFHYVLKYGDVEYNEKNKTYDFKSPHIKEFSIKYFYENGKWNTNDKDNLEKLDSCF